MSESDEPLDAETRTAGGDPLIHDDLLSPPADVSQPPEDGPAADDLGPDAPAGVSVASGPRDPVRRLVPIGWALVVVAIIAAALMVIALQRISSEVNRLSCVDRAQANFQGSAGSRVNSATGSLARLGLQVALRKCGT